MPFTPLHMGPGLVFKALGGRRFSVLTFGIAQVAMDIEPLVGILSGAEILHGATHTYLAALFIGLATALIAPPVCRPILRRWNRELSYYKFDWLTTPETFERWPVLVGALVGTFSHIFFDSFMHSEMHPFAPWSQINTLIDRIPIDALNTGCLIAGLVGVLGWFVGGWLKRRVG